jgi:hypothetical protein
MRLLMTEDEHTVYEGLMQSGLTPMIVYVEKIQNHLESIQLIRNPVIEEFRKSGIDPKRVRHDGVQRIDAES